MEHGAVSGRALPVRITDMVKRYGSVRAIDGVSLSVNAGEFVTLLGPSGSGKTSLLMALAGFARPDAGSIKVGEQEIVLLPPHKRDIGMVFQNYALFPHMNVGQNIAYPLKLRRVGKVEIAERVARALDLVQLDGYAERRVDALSGGQRQRVALARAIVFEPGILLMDEPLSALDKQLRERMQVEIRRLHNSLGTTTIAVTHDQREALTMSDRVAVLHQGKLMQFDTPRQLYERPNSRFVAEFIGESNFVPVTIEGGVARYGDLTLNLAEQPRGAAKQLLLLRPEKLVPLNGVVPSGVNCIGGIVADAMFQGDSVLLSVRLVGGHEISARLPNRQFGQHGTPERGAAIQFGLAPEDTLLVAGE